MMTRTEAEVILKKVFGFERFYDEQWQVIDYMLQGKRALMIEKTGYGKSLCFQFPAYLFDGVTVVFSPLIALMRDQAKSLKAKGIAVACINSGQKYAENTDIIKKAIEGKFKILYIAPERQENQEWIDATRQMKLSMVVIDEAHTISVWGHDFRPAFRRIVKLVRLLPRNMPVLATTATATRRVQADIEAQITGNILSIRGELMRENFQLFVIKTTSEDEKMVWLADHFNELHGTGIIYTGTRVNTEIYTRWLKYLGIKARQYNASLDSESRKEIEAGLMNNRWKVVVSTNALGMGIDKPDIRFIIHTQVPQSPIHYYQEIGRAGRDGLPTKIILFYNQKEDIKGMPEDMKLPRAFIDGGKPKRYMYERVIEALKDEQLGIYQLMRAANLKQTQIRVIKEDLIEQGIIKEVYSVGSKKLEYQYGAPAIDFSAFETLRTTKLQELDTMVEYVNTTKPRMKFLCDYLGDEKNYASTNCDNTGLRPYTIEDSPDIKKKLIEFRENYFPLLKVKSKKCKLLNGIAASFYGNTNVGAALHRSKYEGGGDFPDFLLKLTLKAIYRSFGNEKFGLLLYAPPTVSGELVRNFAVRLSNALKIPVSHDLVKTRSTEPQKVFENYLLKRENVIKAFSYNNPDHIKGKNILLFDDIMDSGATIKEIGKLLTNLGAQKIIPITIAKAVGGDLH